MGILVLHSLIRHSLNICDCTEYLDMLGMVAASVCVSVLSDIISVSHPNLWVNGYEASHKWL